MFTPTLQPIPEDSKLDGTNTGSINHKLERKPAIPTTDMVKLRFGDNTIWVTNILETSLHYHLLCESLISNSNIFLNRVYYLRIHGGDIKRPSSLDETERRKLANVVFQNSLAMTYDYAHKELLAELVSSIKSTMLTKLKVNQKSASLQFMQQLDGYAECALIVKKLGMQLTHNEKMTEQAQQDSSKQRLEKERSVLKQQFVDAVKAMQKKESGLIRLSIKERAALEAKPKTSESEVEKIDKDGLSTEPDSPDSDDMGLIGKIAYAMGISLRW